MTEEPQFWPAARHVLHFMGVCGAGKTTLSQRIADRCRRYGGIAVGTVDWDPHTADQDRIAERAFRRDLDQAMSAAPGDTAVHDAVVEHSLSMVDRWRRTQANLIVVDRFIESYDHLEVVARARIQDALAAAGFSVLQVLLVVGGLRVDRPHNMVRRLKDTRQHRPASWWATGPATIEMWAEEEASCQATYRAYCGGSIFRTLVIDSTEMSWRLYEETIAHELVAGWSDFQALESEPAVSRHGISRSGFPWLGTMLGRPNSLGQR